MAEVWVTVVDRVHGARVAAESIGTVAGETTVGIGTSGTVRTWIGELALVDVLFTHHPGESGCTNAFHFAVLLTCGSIQAGLGVTEVSVNLTPPPGKPRVAFTREVSHGVCTGTVVATRIWETVIDVHLALQPCETVSTQAFETTDTVHTHPTVIAGRAVALLHDFLAIETRKTSKTFASECSSRER